LLSFPPVNAVSINRRFSVPSRVGSIIDGRPVSQAPAAELPIQCPATEETLGTLAEADAGEVDAAVHAARRAFDHGPWPRMDINERKDVLYAVRDRLRAHAEELAFLECLGSGLPMQSIQRHIDRTARNFEFFAEVASTVRGETYTQTKGFVTCVTREAKGVAALIAPWNAPISLASTRIATCIPWGNTCVLKPSEHVPIAVWRMVQILHEAGLPPGVVNLVNGRGAATGSTLVAHPGIDMVGFTGGTATGSAVAAAAGRALKPVALELGGKSANIVFESAELGRALDGALIAIYSNNGQQCLAGSRILVQRSVADRFIAQFVDRTKRLRIGDPLLPTTEIGPLAYREHFERVLGYVDVAKADGAEVLVGGKRSPQFERGYYFEPTAVLARSNAARVCQEEIFGPFATFLVFDTLDEAIALANDTRFGLAAYVWSDDVATVMRCMRDLRAGTVWVNTPLMRELRAPFGGYKDSGIGRDGPGGSVEFFTEQKATILPIDAPALRRMGSS
jgi:acyl-CoA reductase-like NAD-dependent aldehyde dehydrogenase